ncbi:ADAMTS like 5 [Phyllostomus discolor]|uniref:ADAMTS like 5 n=1 Tax=Phyllostomus discolor TaxID=89673 RepID=A0A834DVV4_9CHIR|nr:ADAMTS like 5 [Phyllostomus discolor]
MAFRDIQCALYNGQPVLSLQKTYQWIPFYGAPNQCDLNCLALGHAFYHSFGRVLDGTPCSPGSQGLCVGGRCLSAGCDGLMGSDAREDHCGRCGGANDSCLFVQRVFRDAGAYAGYWNVTLIPEGARHIYAAHRSRNYLALIGGDGRYVLNGKWEISPPGTYDVAGTRVVYTRATGPEETLRAAGPTTQDLLLQVLLQEPNPGIEFEFWLPRELYGPFQEQTQALSLSLRQPQPLEVEPQSSEPNKAPAFPTRTPNPTPGEGETTTTRMGASRECSELECWATSARPRRPAMRCVCNLSTRTAHHCRPLSMYGHQVAAPAHQCPSIESTCWLPSASSVPMALRTGCCCPTQAMPGPGAPPRTAVYAWLLDTALSEPLDRVSPTQQGSCA